jgi:phospholipid-translocating ATPase
MRYGHLFVCSVHTSHTIKGNLAREGLRTLVFGRRRMSDEEYSHFAHIYQEAKTTISNREEHVREAIDTIEANLELIGLTGVEDKLQPFVKESIEMLRTAGIKIWMLTGDKIETATCIAISTKLVSRNQSIFNLLASNKNEAYLLFYTYYFILF